MEECRECDLSIESIFHMFFQPCSCGQEELECLQNGRPPSGKRWSRSGGARSLVNHIHAVLTREPRESGSEPLLKSSGTDFLKWKVDDLKMHICVCEHMESGI